mgnify:CR=1 FL=1
MQKEVYTRHIQNFSNHWWFQARKNIIYSVLKKFSKKKIKILDFGAGSGVNLDMLSKFGEVNIYEPNKIAKKYLKKEYNKKNFKILNTFKNKKFDLIILADVLEHIKNDKSIINNLSKTLNQKGHILITVPAYNFLFSKKDIILKHYRRYSKGKITEVFKDFKVKKLTFFNFYLFLPLSIIIIIMKFLNINFIDNVEKVPKRLLNTILFKIFVSEIKLLNFINLPFGLSILGLFQKK